jgi:hypothetical protein
MNLTGDFIFVRSIFLPNSANFEYSDKSTSKHMILCTPKVYFEFIMQCIYYKQRMRGYSRSSQD